MCDVATQFMPADLPPKLQKFPAKGCPVFPEKPETKHKNILFAQQQIRLQNTMATRPIPVKPVRRRVSGWGWDGCMER